MFIRWMVLAAAMLLTPSFAQSAGLEDLIGHEFSVATVAVDGDTLLVVGHPRLPAPDGHTTVQDLIVTAFLEAGSARIRLWGISAPEYNAPGGWQATGALDEILTEYPAQPVNSGWLVTCVGVDVHKPSRGASRLVARCQTGSPQQGGNDLGLEMLEGGWATPYRIYTWSTPLDDGKRLRAAVYDAASAHARRDRRGLWALPGM